MKNYELISKKILENVGGTQNISLAFHCITRLRLNVKDNSIVKIEEIKKIDGIIGVQYSVGQLQIIIGPEIETLYPVFCKVAGIQENEKINENLDENQDTKEKNKLTAGTLLNGIMDAISGCVTPVLPIFTILGLSKLLVALLGPTMLKILPEDSQFMMLMAALGDAILYFLPFFIAYSSSKKFKANTVHSMVIAALLLSPSFLAIIESGEPFSVYGIPMTLFNYAGSFIPMILIVYVQHWIEKLVDKITPKSLRTMLYPFFTIILMLPIGLCVLGPIGTFVGKGFAALITMLHKVAGPLATGILGACWPLIVSTGLHHALTTIAITTITAVGFDDNILVGAALSFFPQAAVAIAFVLKSIKAKKEEARSYGIGAMVSHVFAGISEPLIFGILFRYKKSIISLVLGDWQEECM